MRLHLLAFGKLKTPGLREAADYYEKLLQPLVPVDEVELKPQLVTTKDAAIRRQIQEKEGEQLSKELLKLKIGVPGIHSGRGHFYLLDEGGQSLDTLGWAKLAREWEESSVPAIALCIGSSLGFSPTIREAAQKTRRILSLGPQTLPHELARVVVLEQLYRAWSVIRGHPYHNQGS